MTKSTAETREKALHTSHNGDVWEITGVDPENSTFPLIAVCIQGVAQGAEEHFSLDGVPEELPEAEEFGWAA